MPTHFTPVPLDKAYRLLTLHGGWAVSCDRAFGEGVGCIGCGLLWHAEGFIYKQNWLYGICTFR